MGLKNIIAATATAMAVSIDPKKLLDGLNPEQEAAVLFGEGPILVAAVAGAGKTRALVHRVAHLVSQRKINPARILAVTFSKAGADEMNDRLEKMIPESKARIGTFHSVALEICKSEIPGYLGEVDGKDRYRYCVKDAAGYRELKWKSCDINMTRDFIGFCKSNMARPFSEEAMTIARERYYYQHGPAKADPKRLNEVYERAEEIRRDRQLITFDDMMIDAAELLRDNESARKRWAQHWDYVLQDEAQDQNKVQLVLGELLARDHRNYLLVGDPAQAIYAWRGAMPSMLLSFESRWNAKVVKMGRNYRCGQLIIDTANKVLDAMDPSTRLDMHMICEKSTQGEVLCRQYENLDEEAEGIAGEIAQLLEDGTEPRDCALCACDKCTNALISHYEENPIGPNQSIRIIQHSNANSRSRQDNGLQSNNDRPLPEENGETSKEKSSRHAQWEMEGWPVQDGQRIHRQKSSSSEIPLRTQNHHGTDTQQTTEKVRSGSPQKRQYDGQQTRKPEVISEQFEAHTPCSRCQSPSTAKVLIHADSQKTQPRDVAILFRTNAQSRAPEEALISRRIPYMIVGGTNFYNRKEVKDLLAYLRIADGRGTLDDVRRCINAPFRFLGKEFVKKVTDVATSARRAAKKEGKRVHWPSVVREACSKGHVQYRQKDSANEWSDILTNAMDNIKTQKESERDTPNWDAGKPVNILEGIVLETRYADWLVKDEGEETTENSRVSNVRELIRASRRFPTVTELLDFIDDLTEASKRNRKGQKPNKVILTTLHRSKGLEWENVFVTGANEYLLPHARSEDIDEERRLFYVGVTRAKERLAISCVGEIAVGDKVRNAYPSPFLAEAGLDPTIMVREEVETEAVPTLRIVEPVDNGPLFDNDLEDDDDSEPAPNAPFLN